MNYKEVIQEVFKGKKILTGFNTKSIFIPNNFSNRRNTQTMLIARVENIMNHSVSVNYNQGLILVYAIRSINIVNL